MENKEIELEFSIKSGAPEKQRTACVVVGVFESRKLSGPAIDIDRASDGYLSEILRGGDMDGRAGSTLLLHRVPNILADRVLLVGLGKEREFHEKAYRDAIACAVRTLRDTGSMDATITLSEIPVRKRDVNWNIEQAVISAHEALYRFVTMKSKPDETRRPLKRVTFAVSRRGELKLGELGLARGLAIAHGIDLAKNLGNTPSNICTPEYLADEAKKLAKTYGFGCEILDQAACEKLGMGAFLSVGKGSDKPPRFIILRHNGGAKGEKPIVLVGKAVTFDAGGISLKPPAEMDEMNYDMSGGGALFGAFRAIGELGLPLNVVGLVPSCENLPDAHANKPGDIVTSMSGQTIEVLNTDAEGRLLLCDALTYAERFEPDAVVDLATLTGACVIALGAHPSALYANHDPLAREIEHAADQAWDRVWRMPLWDDYQEQLKSSLADMANIGGRPAGSITAACFLSRFARKYHWAHLDIAGTAYKGGREKTSTGRPVSLLVHILLNRAQK
ncbi:MAG: leucyl aminopeptidase [Thiobacillus sp.]|uniref:leucyl aminopeptidase n=1 Tax=Thiobacillus sp. TaxID=924 RepID=UPI002893A006|nr:leucyl aminopeptidase [Thiobacillus sp.]MDT3708004.1 leucyl aminopeptidase [Thiobacillus sp.]